MNWLVDPLTAPYLQRSLAMLVVLSLPAGALGALVLLRGNVFTAHALGTGAFPGIVAAAALGVDASIGALAAALVMALVIAVVRRAPGVDASVATALALVAALALGSWLASQVVAVDRPLSAVLFGSLLSVTDGDLLRGAAVALVAIAAVLACGRGWLTAAFDPGYAKALGARASALDLAFLLVLALTVVALVDAVGSLLVATLLVVPAATARLLTGGLAPLMVVSGTLALVVSTVGLLGAYWLDAPPGAMIAVVATLVFLVVFAVSSLPERAVLGRVAAVVGLVLLVSVAAGCGDGDEPTGTVRIAATTPQVADWARRVGGERVSVSEIVPPNVDPHDFEPSPSDAGAIANADLVLSNGSGLDGWLEGLAVSAGAGARIVEVAPVAAMRRAQADDGGLDPHFWHDPRLVVRAVHTIEAALARADSAGAPDYVRNTARYVAHLRALDVRLQAEYGRVPPGRRTIVTDHEAFGYLARRYGLTIAGTVVPSLSTAAEPAAKELAGLADTVERLDVCVVLSERSVDPRLAEQVAAETGATVESDLYGDTLGARQSDAGTYVAMMEHNARVIVSALSCEER